MGWRMIFSLTLAVAVALLGKREFYTDECHLGCAGKGEWHDSTITLTDLSTGLTSYNTVR